jgi:LigT like Phosphoesterase
VRWVHPEALHITVHFFGNITDEQVGSGLQAVMPVADDTPPLPAGLDGLGTFPPRGRTRVLWLGASKEMPMVGEICNALRDIFGVHHPAGGIWGAAEPGGTIALIAHAANSTAFKCTWRAQHTLPTQQRFGRTHRPVRR